MNLSTKNGQLYLGKFKSHFSYLKSQISLLISQISNLTSHFSHLTSQISHLNTHFSLLTTQYSLLTTTSPPKKKIFFHFVGKSLYLISPLLIKTAGHTLSCCFSLLNFYELRCVVYRFRVVCLCVVYKETLKEVSKTTVIKLWL